MDKSRLKWSRPLPIRKADNIISSDVAAAGETAFKPSYEDMQIENMGLLMSNEYMRIWFKERDEYSARMKAEREAKIFCTLKEMTRRTVQKNNVVKPKIKELKIIQLKQFQNIPSKIDTGRNIMPIEQTEEENRT